jgi:acetyltransferase-like isoleucine patch superfamily enzyme
MKKSNLGAYLDVIVNTPWKFFAEARMYFVKPFVLLYLKISGVNTQKGYKFYGFPKVLKHKNSKIHFGKRFENRNWWASNPLGISHPTIICTWQKGAEIIIGNDVGISGGAVVASKKIEIGDGTIVGANCLIIDSDFHPIKSENRRHDRNNIKSLSIQIGKNVFLGTNCVILKGVKIPDDVIIPAGAIVRGDKALGYKLQFD